MRYWHYVDYASSLVPPSDCGWCLNSLTQTHTHIFITYCANIYSTLMDIFNMFTCYVLYIVCVFVCINSYIFTFQLFITDILICNLFNDSLRRALNSLHQVWEFSSGRPVNPPLSAAYLSYPYLFELLTHLVRQASKWDWGALIRLWGKAITSKNSGHSIIQSKQRPRVLFCCKQR